MIRAYLTRLFLGRMLAALIGLSAMLQILNLLENAGTIFAHGGFRDILHFIALQLPAIVSEMLPLSVLIGALMAFRRLAADLEVTTLRGAGMSLWQMVGALMPVCLVLCVLQFALQNEVAPKADRAFANWWAATIPPAADSPPPRIWLRAGSDVAAVDSVSTDGRTLRGVMVLERDGQGEISLRLDAPIAHFGPAGWVLQQVRVTRPEAARVQDVATMPWPQGPEPANMQALAWPTDSITLGRILAVLHGHWAGSQGLGYYRTELQAAFAALLSPMIMLLLAAPVLLAPPRSTGNTRATATGLALGLGFAASAGLLNAFGQSGALPPWLAGWMAALFFFAFACLRLSQADDSEA
ncbi:LptF/LptG family permease [Acidisoma cellulosilytica]|uniref:LptF/LptG family permease n=1 Tax=Acidisoma cellulosilyticum TaxID=2802395 RepID=A0A963Z468_9PROT|nr:LptF/LptG family permease [Acidisoma cellulosilyticum]MCB8882457.1 LptF/LptG family permease [Acidisoma cellulosilyticum]